MHTSRSRTSTARRLLAAIATTAAATVAVVAPTAAASSEAPAPPPARETEQEAEALARATGVRVEVTGKRTEHDTLYANPDGSRTWTQSTSVVRVRRGDGWVPPDPTMVRRPDGTIGPAAAVIDLRVSRGGGEPLAELRKSAASMALSWPAPLPEPVLAGPTATYPEVLPGVDLVVTATPTAFSEVLVVKSREAARNPALRQVTFPMRATGMTLRQGADGGISGVDADGRTLVTSRPPLMWDSSAGHGVRPMAPKDGDKVARMRADVTPASLTVTPDPAMLADPATRFPLYLDPWWDSDDNIHLRWAMVDETYPTTAYPNFGGDQGVGYQNFSGVSKKRQFHMFDIGFLDLKDHHIQLARFRAFETHAATCTPTEVELWRTGSIPQTGTTWTTQPSWIEYVSSRTVAYGRDGCEPGGADVEFGATPAVMDALTANAATLTLGLRAGSETSSSYWKRFSAGAELEVAYNTYPGDPASVDVVGPAYSCTTSGTDRDFINDSTPTFNTVVEDEDMSNVRAEFDYGLVNGTRTALMSTAKLAGSTFDVTVSSPLEDGRLYSFRARGWDGLDYSKNYSPRCEFVVDTAAPSTPGVTSSDFIEDGTQQNPSLKRVGQSGTFTITPALGDNDVDYFRYKFNSDTATSGKPDPATLNVGSEMSFTPKKAGLNWVEVTAYDRADNPSTTRTYYFMVAEAERTGWWRFNDSDRYDDSSSAERDVTLTGTATWGQGRKHGFEQSPDPLNSDYALLLDGTTGAADTGTKVLDTTKGFTVSAWVDLSLAASRTGTYVAVSQNGTNARNFQLGFSNGKWFAELAASDSATAAKARAEVASTYQDGQGNPPEDSTLAWAKLTAVYDGAQLTLYVNNGTQASFPPSSVTVTSSTWATGATFRIGSTTAGSGWVGRVDEVVVFPSNIGQDVINQL